MGIHAMWDVPATARSEVETDETAVVSLTGAVTSEGPGTESCMAQQSVNDTLEEVQV